MSEKESVNAQMSEHDREKFSEQLAQQVSLETEQEVPHWHRAEAFEQHFKGEQSTANGKSINWGMWFGVPALSMACSAFAIMVVMSFTQEQGLDQQALTAFIDQQVQQKVSAQLASQISSKSNDDVETLVTLKLREFAAEQQVVLANYRADMSAEQQKNNLALAGYVIGASRKERKEDMSDFISFINAQREDEQLAQKIKFQQLEREVGFQKLGLKKNNNLNTNQSKPINYKG
jgi:hypothetical protein